jgi:germination protein M
MKRLAIYILVISLVAVGVTGCLRKGTTRKEQMPERAKKVISSAKKAEEVAAEKESEKASNERKISSQEDTSLLHFSVYFSDDQANYLVKEERTAQVSKVIGSELDMKAKLAVEALVEGPTQPNLYPTIPEGTKLLGLEIKDQIAYVDFSKELAEKHWGGSTGELLTIGSIVNTLVQFPGIEKVQILIEGRIKPTLAGHADISVPLAKNKELLKE